MSSQSFPFAEKIELQLAEHIKKAINPTETAPKQKHVRWCILYAWEHQSCHDIWNSLKMQPAVSSEVGAFKSLVMIHKILMGGPPVVLVESYLEKSFFEMFIQYFCNNSPYGYGNLIRSYVSFLKDKLDFHHVFKEFTGNFDFEAFTATSSTKDVNEAYQILCELMNLQEKLEVFYNAIFNTFGSSLTNECRVSSLVPIVEETYGIYNFITSYLLNLFNTCENLDPLYPLQERYSTQFYSLKKFYEDCSKIQYLTSLISIPQLPNKPPLLFQNPNKTVEKKSIPFSNVHPTIQYPPTPSNIEPGNGYNLLNLPSSSSSLALNAPSQNDRIIEEYMKEIQNLKMQIQKDQMIIGQYCSKFSSMEQNIQLLTMKLQQSSQQHDNSLLSSLQEQVNAWKTKYEALLEMYNNLKRDHFELLEKFKTSVTSPDQLNRLKEEINRLTSEKRQSNMELERTKENSQIEIAKLRKEMIDLKSAQVNNDSLKEKEREFKSKIEKLLFENSELSDKIEKLSSLEKYSSSLVVKFDLEKDELLKKISSLESGKETSESSLIDSFNDQFSTRENAFRILLIESFILRVAQVVDDFSNPSFSGNTCATVSIVLTYLESLNSSITENSYSPSQSEFESIINLHHEICTFFNAAIYSIRGLLSNSSFAIDAVGSDSTDKNEKCKNLITEMSEGLCSFFKDANSLPIVESLSKCITFINSFENESEQNQQIKNMSEFVNSEITNAVTVIKDAIDLLNSLKCDISIKFSTTESAILDGTIALTEAISHLIKCATIVQNEIVSQGKGTGSVESFYKKHHRWTEGLISAAKTVAYATKFLVEIAEGVVRKTRTMDELIVASRDVTASTAQLVASARVKASRDSKFQWNLEEAASAVNQATKILLSGVEKLNTSEETLNEEFSKFSIQQLKVHEMNQQVKILSLERSLQDARKELGLMRKASYHKEIN